MKLSDVPTPALCVDLDVMERNLSRMHSFFEDRPCNVRPHLKAHKTPAIAHRQHDAGGVGFCCATLGEAEVFAAEGFDDLLIANEICDPTKVERLIALSKKVNLTVAVDSRASCDIIVGSDLNVLIDVNVGMPRCGVAPDDAAEVARLATRAGLHVIGIMGYEGHVTVMEDRAERADATRKSMEILLSVAARLRDAGYRIDVVSAGSTLTYDVTGTMPGITEIQAGSYVLMDTEFAKSSDFEEALRCMCTLVSVQGRIAVLDGGLKALATDHGNPGLFPDAKADVLYLSDEHTSLVTNDGFDAKVGGRMWLRPSHVDPTVNLHDRLFAYRGDEVVEVWPVAARGYRTP